MSSVLGVFTKKASELSPEQIEALGNTVSHTGTALSHWITGGLALFIIGAIMLAWSSSKRAGVIFMACGAGASFTAYAIEEYALYSVGGGLFIASLFGVYELGSKVHYKLGFERGKDYEEENN